MRFTPFLPKYPEIPEYMGFSMAANSAPPDIMNKPVK